MSLKNHRRSVKTYLKRHWTFAEEAKWNASEYRDELQDDRFIYADGLKTAVQAIHDFQLVRYWARMTEETNNSNVMMQYFCLLRFKFGFCHHCWVLQILLNQSKTFIIPYQTSGAIEVEDIPMRKTYWHEGDKLPSRIPRDWTPVS